jgi:uracil-DNA glycosylase
MRAARCPEGMDDSLDRLRADVVACRLCPRLVTYRERTDRERKREFRDQPYWARPVPGFGDPAAALVVVGLAPSAHGANRTGRMFTGDRSASFLVRALHATGYANRPTSVARGDGLAYTGLYLTAAVRCAPPGNQPNAQETARCLPFLERELRLLRETRAVLALGGFAWSASLQACSRVYGGDRSRVPFAHGACVALGEGRPLVWASYHPSPQNTNTGKLTETMLVDLLRRIRASYAADRRSPQR